MTRAPSSCSEEKDGLKKGPWTPDEDHKLVAYIQEHGHGSWRSLPLNAGLQRCGKSCRLRWTNYLRPDIKRGRFSQDEDQMIVHLHAILGNRWSAIASHIPRRTDNEIKNYWNTHLKKRLVQMGIDPVTHTATTVTNNTEDHLILDSLLPGLRPVVSSNLSHMSQWENARAEAEARLSRQSSTLGPIVEVEKYNIAPVNLQKFLQEWDSSLQLSAFSGYDSPIDVPDLSSGTTSEVVSPCATPQPCFNYVLPSSAQITERLLATSNFRNHNNMFSSETQQFSPTSTLHVDPDNYDCSYTNSPCVSSSNHSSAFDLLLHLIPPENELQTSSCRGNFMQFDPQPSFWCRQQQTVAMADELLQPAAYFLPELQVAPEKPSFNIGTPNNIPIPQFDFLC